MIIGIPQAFLYHRYHTLWATFFDTLGVQTVYSGPTDREKMDRGTRIAIDEACLSSKVYLGHVDSLLGRCDQVFVPRVASMGYREITCTKFFALPDIVHNTFRDEGVEVLDCNVDVRRSQREITAFLGMGKALGKRKGQALHAYMLAKQAEQIDINAAISEQARLLERDGIKILVVGHSYNMHDAWIGAPVLAMLRAQGATPILADVVNRRAAIEASRELTETLPWVFNRELVGAVQLYRNRVDGIILMSTFPCGPDSLVNDTIIRRVKDRPILNLLLDSQEGTAGMETRIESFVDILRYRKEAQHG